MSNRSTRLVEDDWTKGETRTASTLTLPLGAKSVP